MSKVLFLGAGASVDAGYPPISKLLEEIDPRNSCDAQLKKYWEKFREFVDSPNDNLLQPALKSSNPEKFAKAIVEATKHYDNPKKLLEVSRGLGAPMHGTDISTLSKEQRMQERGI